MVNMVRKSLYLVFMGLIYKPTFTSLGGATSSYPPVNSSFDAVFATRNVDHFLRVETHGCHGCFHHIDVSLNPGPNGFFRGLPIQLLYKYRYLVGGLEHEFYFSTYWEFHHPN